MVRILCSFIAFIVAVAAATGGGFVEEKDGKTIIHLMLWQLPNPADPSPGAQSEVAVVKEFVRQFPKIFTGRHRDKYRANPER
jgi:hypothetical protein